MSAAGGPVVPLAAALLVGFCTDRILSKTTAATSYDGYEFLGTRSCALFEKPQVLGMGFAGIRCRCHRSLSCAAAFPMTNGYTGLFTVTSRLLLFLLLLILLLLFIFALLL